MRANHSVTLLPWYTNRNANLREKIIFKVSLLMLFTHIRNFRYTIVLFIFLLSIKTGVSEEVVIRSVSADDSFSKAQELYFQQEFYKAEPLFEECMKLEPRNADYRCWLAQCKAFIMADKAMKGDSKFSLIPLGKSIRELYKDALEVDPNCERAKIGYSTLLRDIPGWLGGSVSQAEEMLTGVLKENPTNIFALHNMGTLLVRKRKEYEKGLDYLEKAIEQEKARELNLEEQRKLSNTYNAIGKTYLEELDNPEKAQTYFERSYALFPKDIVTMLDLIEVYRETKQKEKAKDFLFKALDFAKTNEYQYFYNDIKRAAKKLGVKEEISL
jgi:tetratricopeptide (TPR) repeat protein